MDLESLIGLAHQNGASDLHLEAGLPPALRVRGALRTLGEPIPAAQLLAMARQVIPEDQWQSFTQRHSFDMSRTLHGVRCRINVLQSSRGVGFAIRLLASFQATLERLNLHPDLRRLLSATHGLVLISGPTGSGKSSTLAAFIQEINQTESRHIVTIESPIEYTFRSQRSYIRQREVGRDTPSFQQALLDALREDPDVLMVGEMREPETMRLTLGAAETGHLVLSTVHSGTCAEALQRIISAFPSEIQMGVAAQLSDCLVAVVAQKLRFQPELNLRLPECEVLIPTHAVRNFIRSRDFFKISSALETGAEQGMWTFQRYRAWMEKHRNWHVPDKTEVLSSDEPVSPPVVASALTRPESARQQAASATPAPAQRSGRIEIEPSEGEFGKILKHP